MDTIETESANPTASDGACTPRTDEETLVSPGSPNHHQGTIDQWLSAAETTITAPPSNGEITRTCDPCVGETYLIVDSATGRALTSYGGILCLESAHDLGHDECARANRQWLCTEKEGLRGFQNIGGRGFLGHDSDWEFYANVHHHDGWESFILWRHEGGYYWIQALRWWAAWQVSARRDHRGLVGEKHGGTLWEFVRVRGAARCTWP